jgi:NRPS condensation-like uncharacterized protein
MLRKLGIFERALVLTDRHAPFNVISVLQLENTPSPETFHRALEMLQRRHPLLRACIKGGRFEELSAPDIPIRVIERTNDAQWLEIVEQEMNTRLDASTGLSRATYLFGNGRSEFVLTFHHAIVDAVSGMNLLHELLTACAASTELPALPLVPPVEERFPPNFKGLRGMLAVLKYAAGQIGEEIGYWWHVRGKRFPVVREGGRGFASTLILPESLVTKLSQQSRKHRITLNSLLNAALALAVNRQLYDGEQTPMRTFVFADLRPYSVPPLPSENLANYISIMRFTIDVAGKGAVWDLARILHNKIYRTLKSGDKFIAARMIEPLMKMLLALSTLRMGAAGLNYNGEVTILPAYGDIKVLGLHGFLSGYDIGPEVSSQARIFNDELWWDFMFLESDMSHDLAEKIIREITIILEDEAGG